MINIDGSYLEGGGQIIRTALAFSTLTGKPFSAKNIRKGRQKPGLKTQHLFSIRALKELCNAEVEGDSLGSLSLKYKPGKLEFHNLNIDIGTAGSITLLLQALMPVIMFSDKKLIIKVKGGTDTKYSMPIDYFMDVLLPHLKRYADFETELHKRGYYPKGQGKFILKIKPKYNFSSFKKLKDMIKMIREETQPILLDSQGKLMLIKGVSHASKELMKASVADRQAKSARYMLNNLCPIKIEAHYIDTPSIGSGITLWALFSKGDELDFENPIILGADALGEKGKKAENVGEEAAFSLKKEIDSGAAADSHLADQMIPFLALSKGTITTSRITDHCKANIYVVEKFLSVKFKTEKNIISC